MMLDGVDLDINFGLPIDVAEQMQHPVIEKILSGPVSETLDKDPKVGKHLHNTAAKMMQVYMNRIYSGDHGEF